MIRPVAVVTSASETPAATRNTSCNEEASAPRIAWRTGGGICATAAGLNGTVVPVWNAGFRRMGYLAPERLRPYFDSAPLPDLQAKINKTLTFQF